jgi:beta-aspartyl-peptidase (threonine type)
MHEAWSIIVHGGAKTIPPERQADHRRGCLAAVAAGQAILEPGGRAVDAVIAAIRVLEDDATFNAGYGSVVNADGVVECDAALMDGASLDVGAVAALQGVRNPIAVAAHMLREPPVLLVGEGAWRFALEMGCDLCDPAALVAPEPVDAGCDTVGCVAYDSGGNVASGTSTGGLKGVRAGRVGDSALPGCGLYADNGLGGVSFSGDGEGIIRLALAARLMREIETLGADAAARKVIPLMERVNGEAGCIVLGAGGEPGFAHNSHHFAVALAASQRPAQAFLSRSECSDV